jgi:integrase
VRRGFALGALEDPPLVRKRPAIPKLEEDNARQGFITHEQYEVILHELPDRLKALFVCAYHVGTRKGELRKIRWDQVDWKPTVTVRNGCFMGRPNPNQLAHISMCGNRHANARECSDSYSTTYADRQSGI